ncbi:MAG: hypothetical protein WDZ84_13930 [Rhodovibrionaceae bacterium]
MRKKLSCAVTALAAALLLGGEAMSILTSVYWAVASELGKGLNALETGALWAAVPSLAIAFWIARSAYFAEMETGNDIPEELPAP